MKKIFQNIFLKSTFAALALLAPLVAIAVTTLDTQQGLIAGKWSSPEAGGRWELDIKQSGSVLAANWFLIKRGGAVLRYVIPSCVLVGGASSTDCDAEIFNADGTSAGKIRLNFFNSYLVAGTVTGAISGTVNGSDFGVGSLTHNMPTTVWGMPDESDWSVTLTDQMEYIRSNSISSLQPELLAVNMFTLLGILSVENAFGSPNHYVIGSWTKTKSGYFGHLFPEMHWPVEPGDSAASIQYSLTESGTVTINLLDAANGTITYTIDGRTSTKVMTRLDGRRHFAR